MNMILTRNASSVMNYISRLLLRPEWPVKIVSLSIARVFSITDAHRTCYRTLFAAFRINYQHFGNLMVPVLLREDKEIT